MSITVSAKWLHEKMNHSELPLVVFDTRFDLADANLGFEAFKKEHIVGAQYLDLNKDLSGDIEIHGGSHPLPNVEQFAMKIGVEGVSNETIVVVYDDGNGMFSARAWWNFYYMGHEHVYVLESGLRGWKEAGYEMTSEQTKPTERTFTPHIRVDEIAHMEEVKQKSLKKEAIVIDSRARDRYLGNVEPMYAKSGHIPRSKNYFWEDVLKEDGTWKDMDQLKEHFQDFDKDEEIIVSCGSGVSACPNIIGLKKAGFTNVKLYPGSFSDWISYSENKIETKEE